MADGNIRVDITQVDCGTLVEGLKWLRKNVRTYSRIWTDLEKKAFPALLAERQKGGTDGQ